MEPEGVVAAVARHFGIRLRQVTADSNEWRSLNGCPVCGDGGKGSRSDRFRVFTGVHGGSPRYWCRRCGFRGFIDELDGGTQWRDLDREERRRRMINSELRAEREREQERQLRQAALQQLRESGDAARYHADLVFNAAALNYWFAEGFTGATIERFQLGYCEACPMDYPRYRPSVTIPVTAGGLLFNIRHRILEGASGDKYRPHLKHLPLILFNADNLMADDTTTLLVVEGEKKSMMCSQQGWLSVGIFGQNTFDTDWVPTLRRFTQVYVVLDPDAQERAQAIAALIGPHARAVQLPDKLDDMLNPYRGGVAPQRVWQMIVGGAA